MRLFHLISWPYVRRHVLRTALTVAGIVLGVGLFVAMHTANQSVLSAFSQTIDRIAGRTELQITAGDAGFGEDVLDRVQSASTVRVAVPVIEAIVESGLAGQGTLLVLGIDMTGDANTTSRAARTPSSTIRSCFSRSRTRSSCRRSWPTGTDSLWGAGCPFRPRLARGRSRFAGS